MLMKPLDLLHEMIYKSEPALIHPSLPSKHKAKHQPSTQKALHCKWTCLINSEETVCTVLLTGGPGDKREEF